jgi:DNA invertase Pin-like site-specific DNA recombinase
MCIQYLKVGGEEYAGEVLALPVASAFRFLRRRAFAELAEFFQVYSPFHRFGSRASKLFMHDQCRDLSRQPKFRGRLCMMNRASRLQDELDKGASKRDLAGFVEDLREKGVDIDLVNQPIGTVGEDDWMAEMMLNMMMVFADAERKMIRSRIQEGIDAAIADGKRVGRPPFGYTVEDGILQQIPSEYVRAQSFIREVRKGREKHATAAFFEIPDTAIQSILARAEANYDIPFDNDQWQLERAKIDAGEKELPPLDVRNERRGPPAKMPTE